jgi:hypothetical protein
MKAEVAESLIVYTTEAKGREGDGEGSSGMTT